MGNETFYGDSQTTPFGVVALHEPSASPSQSQVTSQSRVKPSFVLLCPPAHLDRSSRHYLVLREGPWNRGVTKTQPSDQRAQKLSPHDI